MIYTTLILLICIVISCRYELQWNENDRMNPLTTMQRLNEVVTKGGSLQDGKWTHSANDEYKPFLIVIMLIFYNVLGKRKEISL